MVSVHLKSREQAEQPFQILLIQRAVCNTVCVVLGCCAEGNVRAGDCFCKHDRICEIGQAVQIDVTLEGRDLCGCLGGAAFLRFSCSGNGCFGCFGGGFRFSGAFWDEADDAVVVSVAVVSVVVEDLLVREVEEVEDSDVAEVVVSEDSDVSEEVVVDADSSVDAVSEAVVSDSVAVVDVVVVSEVVVVVAVVVVSVVVVTVSAVVVVVSVSEDVVSVSEVVVSVVVVVVSVSLSAGSSGICAVRYSASKV